MYRDLTRGSILRSLLLFALPMLAGDILQQLYNIADTLIVSRAIGRDALALTVRGEDGRAPRSALHDTVLRRTGAADARGIVEFTYHGASKAEVAALAAEVLRLAAQGDAQSAAILRREAEELRELVSALARELAIAQPRIALMGGLLAEENVYRKAVCAALSGMAQPVRPLHDALWGAAQLAFEALGE